MKVKRFLLTLNDVENPDWEHITVGVSYTTYDPTKPPSPKNVVLIEIKDDGTGNARNSLKAFERSDFLSHLEKYPLYPLTNANFHFYTRTNNKYQYQGTISKIFSDPKYDYMDL